MNADRERHRQLLQAVQREVVTRQGGNVDNVAPYIPVPAGAPFLSVCSRVVWRVVCLCVHRRAKFPFFGAGVFHSWAVGLILASNDAFKGQSSFWVAYEGYP